MNLLKPVVQSLKWKLVDVAGDCRVGNCTKRGLKRLKLCAAHTAEYRHEQHRLAQKRLNDARALKRAARRASKRVMTATRRVVGLPAKRARST